MSSLPAVGVSAGDGDLVELVGSQLDQVVAQGRADLDNALACCERGEHYAGRDADLVWRCKGCGVRVR